MEKLIKKRCVKLGSGKLTMGLKGGGVGRTTDNVSWVRCYHTGPNIMAVYRRNYVLMITILCIQGKRWFCALAV